MRHNHIFSSTGAPRAIARGLIGVRAEAKPQHPPTLAGLQAALDEFTTGHIARVEALEDAMARRDAAETLNGGAGFRSRPEDPEYSTIFASYFRRGGDEEAVRKANGEGQRAQILAAMTVGTNSDGGYLAPTEWDRRIRKAQRTNSPMRRLATVQETSVGAFSTVWSNEQWGSGWVGETAARPATSTPTLSTLTFASGEIYANVAASQRILDDALIDIDGWIADEVEEEFNRQEGVAFISGNGTNKPYGLLTYVTGGAADGVHPGGNLTVKTVAGAAAITADELVDFTYELPAPYRQNASWLMNSLTAAKIAKLKDDDGNYIWREGLIAGQPATLLGRPVEFDEGMPAATAGLTPIAFGDFKAGYLINDRIGIRVLRDPFTNKPFVMFYVTKRVGAGVQDPNAIRLLKMAAS